MGDQPPGRDTPTGTDPEATYEEPGYQDVSLGQAVERDRELAEELVAETDDVGEASRRFAKQARGAPMLGRRSSGDDLGAPDSEHLIAVYLGDHRAGAAAGVEIVRRMRARNRGTGFGAELAALHADILDDRDSLEEIADRLDMPSARTKATLGTLGAKLGVLKPSGRLKQYSPVSRVLEFEALLMAVQAKRELWDVLRFAADGAVDPGELERLVARADSQLDTLRRLHREAALVAFGSIHGANEDG